MSLSQMDGCAALVQDCLNSSDPAEPLLTLCADPKPLAGLAEGDKPHPLVGIVTAMMAGALIDSGGPGDVEVVIERVAELFAPRHRSYVRGSISAISSAPSPICISRPFVPSSLLPITRRHSRPCCMPPMAPSSAALDPAGRPHPGADPRSSRHRGLWAVLHRTRLAARPPGRDPCLLQTRSKPRKNLPFRRVVHSECAAERTAGARPGGDRETGAAERARDRRCRRYEPRPSRIQRRLRACRSRPLRGSPLSRPYHGAPRYYTFWRFDLERAREMAWTQDMRQNEWLAFLAQTPAYRIFLDDYIRTTSAAGPSESTTQRAICYARCAKTSGTPRRRSGPGCPTGWSRPVSRCAHAAAVRPCDGWGFRHRGEGRLRSIGLVRCPHAIPDRHCSLHPSFPGSGRRSSRQMAQSGRLRNIAGMSAATLPRSISTAP